MTELVSGLRMLCVVGFAFLVLATCLIIFVIGPVQGLLCLVQRARGQRPWQTARLLLMGYAFFASACIAAAWLPDQPHGMRRDWITAVSMLTVALIGVWADGCILRACFVNRQELQQAAQNLLPESCRN